MWALYAMSAVIFAAGAADWQEDFAKQPEAQRPGLEVRYADSTRTAFEIAAEAYNLRGELRKPNRLMYTESDNIMLYINVRDVHGTLYSSTNGDGPTRINLYRRGPYFSEVHWFEWQVADEHGNTAPIRGELVLYCYPDRLRAAITWHAEDRFALKSVSVITNENYTFAAEPMQSGDMQTFSFPLLGTQDPLPESALSTIEATHPLSFDSQRGCYTIGSTNRGGFQEHFYHHPNAYESATFSITNDSVPRTVYICHQTVAGPAGLVEGGLVLDEQGHPLPLLVQISKNFAGEKEEPFYNPQDTPFSETWFPLYLAADESVTLTSLHLYQNWGRHPVKQFSSLGAWMDYFHSSTGVTETTCYVPFKYNALDGVDIADMRAMSQPTFWAGQPQHDNVAGHAFLSYKTEAGWQYLVYQGTEYLNTGPNSMHVVMNYVSSDGLVNAKVETYEFPQQDELRNFFRVTYQLRESLHIADAATDLRLLGIRTGVQNLEYSHAAASNLEPVALAEEGFPVKGHPLPKTNAWMTIYGDPKGSNAIIIRNWLGFARGTMLEPALTVERESDGDSQMWLSASGGALDLPKGTVFQIDGFFLPYGAVDSPAPAAREALAYGEHAPRVLEVAKGAKEEEFPVRIRAEENVAEFTIQGGREVMPVIVSGFTSYRWPQLSRITGAGREPVNTNAVSPLDGSQVFVDQNGRFGAVFLVHTDNTPQTLRATMGVEPAAPSWIGLSPQMPAEGGAEHAVAVSVPGLEDALVLHYPQEVETDRIDFTGDPAKPTPQPSAKLARDWRMELAAQWFEWRFDDQVVGGRLATFEDYVDLQAWFENQRDAAVPIRTPMQIALAGGPFDPAGGAQRWVLEEGQWQEWDGSEQAAAAVALRSADGEFTLAIAWEQLGGLSAYEAGERLRFSPAWPACPPNRRAHLRGRLYVMQTDMESLAARIRREFPAAGSVPASE